MQRAPLKNAKLALLMSGLCIALAVSACKPEPKSDVAETTIEPTEVVEQPGLTPAEHHPSQVPHGTPLTTIVEKIEKVGDGSDLGGEWAAVVQNLGAGTIRVTLTNITAKSAPEPIIAAYQQNNNVVLDLVRPDHGALGISKYNITVLIGPLQSDHYGLRLGWATKDLARFKVTSTADEHFSNAQKREQRFAVTHKIAGAKPAKESVSQNRYGAASYAVTLKQIALPCAPQHAPNLFTAFADGETLVVQARKPSIIARCASVARDYELVVNTGSFKPKKTIYKAPE